MTRRLTQLTWRMPPRLQQPELEVQADVDAQAVPMAEEAQVYTPMGAYLREVGVPGLADATATPKQTAVALLQSAAEVEHAFVLQYLFAAYSLKPDDVNGAAWSTTLRGIAREEMGHLATVQNLLMVLGEPPHLDRQSYPAPPNYKFEKMLEPFGLDWLGDFVIAESPLGAVLPPPLDRMSSTMAHVGAIYAHLYWLFQPTDVATGPLALTPADNLTPGEHMSDADFASPSSIADLLFQPGDWGVMDGGAVRVLAHGPFADVASLREGALMAIHDVGAQGEGTEPQANSHFERLLPMYNAAAALGTPLPIKPLVKNPHTIPQPENDEGLITDDTALKVARLLNLRYWMVFTEIGHAASVKRSVMIGTKSLKTLLAKEWAKQDMGFIRTLCLALNTLPLKAGGGASDPKAGAPFELPVTFPATDAERWKFYQQVIDESGPIITALVAAIPGLQAIATSDALRRPVIQGQIGG